MRCVHIYYVSGGTFKTWQVDVKYMNFVEALAKIISNSEAIY